MADSTKPALDLTLNTIAQNHRASDLLFRRGGVWHFGYVYVPLIVLLGGGLVANATGIVHPLIAAVPSVPLFFLFMLLEEENDRKLQRLRDAQSHLIISAVLNEANLDLALYLRGNATDDQLSDKSNPQLEGQHHIKTEKVLANALHPIAPFIGIGGKLGTIGAGRADVNTSEWKSVISLLMYQAKIIVFLPWFTSGAIWEAQELKRQALFHKTLFSCQQRIHHMSPPTSGAKFRLQCAYVD